MRFAVIGDTHFVRKESHRKAFLGIESGLGEQRGLQNNLWMTEHVTMCVVDDVGSAEPEFILHTGDIIPGHCDSTQDLLAEMEAALHILRKPGVPLMFCTGTHDGVLGVSDDAALTQLILPEVSGSIGQTVSCGYYAFRRGSCHFIALDYSNWDLRQSDFFEQQLARADSKDFVIVFAHAPFEPIARPFFTNMKFAHDLKEVFARYRVHAFFCGHTHNHTASIHRFGEKHTLQLMSSPIGYIDHTPILLSDVRPLLPHPDSYELGWGFLENSLSSWWLCEADHDTLTMQWHVSGRGMLGSVLVRHGHPPVFLTKPDFPSSCGVLPQLNSIERVRLRIAGSGRPAVNVEAISINGHALTPKARVPYFDAGQFIDVESEAIKPCNKVTAVVSGEMISVGGFVLEVYTQSGCVRSSVSGYFSNNPEHLSCGHVFLPMPPGNKIEFELFFQRAL